MAPTEQRDDPVILAERLMRSPQFGELFKRGMALVEETATYLDGPGRKDENALHHGQGALRYRTESMRLTTLLMQMASWLLLGRAVNEGEMSVDGFKRDKLYVKLRESRSIEFHEEHLPAALRWLIERAMKLRDELALLDDRLQGAPEASETNSPAKRLQDLLRLKFELGNRPPDATE